MGLANSKEITSTYTRSVKHYAGCTGGGRDVIGLAVQWAGGLGGGGGWQQGRAGGSFSWWYVEGCSGLQPAVGRGGWSAAGNRRNGWGRGGGGQLAVECMGAAGSKCMGAAGIGVQGCSW